MIILSNQMSSNNGNVTRLCCIKRDKAKNIFKEFLYKQESSMSVENIFIAWMISSKGLM